MTGLAEYERVGNPDSSFQLTTEHARVQSEGEYEGGHALREVAAATRI